MEILEALKDHFDTPGTIHIYAIDNLGSHTCEIHKMRDRRGVNWVVIWRGINHHYVYYSIIMVECLHIYDAIDAFINMCKITNIVGIDELQSVKLYLFEFNELFHCSRECDIVEHNALYSVHKMSMHTAFYYIEQGMVCSNCYDMQLDGYCSLKHMHELWKKLEPLVRA